MFEFNFKNYIMKKVRLKFLSALVLLASVMFISCDTDSYEDTSVEVSESFLKVSDLDQVKDINSRKPPMNSYDVYMEDGECVYVSYYNSIDDSYSWPPELYYCEDELTGEVYRQGCTQHIGTCPKTCESNTITECTDVYMSDGVKHFSGTNCTHTSNREPSPTMTWTDGGCTWQSTYNSINDTYSMPVLIEVDSCVTGYNPLNGESYHPDPLTHNCDCN